MDRIKHNAKEKRAVLIKRAKGMNRPSGSGSIAASGAAWKDLIDLYCTEHTERQWQRHPKQRR